MNLHLLQIADSALPIGGYSHSWGLEAAIARGTVHDPLTLESWTRAWLCHGVGPLEGVVVASVCRAAAQSNWPAVVEANELLQVSLAPPTLRHASLEMGAQLLALARCWPWAAGSVNELLGVGDVVEWHHAPVFATLAAAVAGAPAEALAVYLHQVALGGIGAGVRAIPIGHTHGQEILARLHDGIVTLADSLAERPLESAGSFCPAYEELCHAQARLYTRIYRS